MSSYGKLNESVIVCLFVPCVCLLAVAAESKNRKISPRVISEVIYDMFPWWLADLRKPWWHLLPAFDASPSCGFCISVARGDLVVAIAAATAGAEACSIITYD